MKKKIKYDESKLDEIIEWMKNISEYYGYHIWSKQQLIDCLETGEGRDYNHWSTGGFEFKITKRGLYIAPIRIGKILTPKAIKKDKIKIEIQEHAGHTYKCPKCEKEGKNTPYDISYVYNNSNCRKCGYKRPSDKLIIELWNQKKTLKEIVNLLDEPNTTYIKTRLTKYRLKERISYIQQNALEPEQIHSVYAWENINEQHFPILKETK